MKMNNLLSLPRLKKPVMTNNPVSMPVIKKPVMMNNPLSMPVMKKWQKPVLVVGLALLLTACAKPKFVGCNDVSCRPMSGDHSMTIWWQPDMRNGPFDYTQASVNE